MFTLNIIHSRRGGVHLRPFSKRSGAGTRTYPRVALSSRTLPPGSSGSLHPEQETQNDNLEIIFICYKTELSYI